MIKIMTLDVLESIIPTHQEDGLHSPTDEEDGEEDNKEDDDENGGKVSDKVGEEEGDEGW